MRGCRRSPSAKVTLRTAELHRKNIYGASVVVVDHRSREIVALIGNLDWNDAKHGGQIAMFERPRSPGSTLKPMLYALAIDRGLALPDYLVADVPNQYGTYRPRNFDGDWAGLVTLRDALSRSLNLPFVDLLDQLGVVSLMGVLARMGVSGARAVPGQYGLSMIVGGIEVTPLELAGMYATLAEDGVYIPLRLTAADPAGGIQPIFSRGVAWMTRQTLSLKDRPDFPKRGDVNGVPPEIHWKTGTSFGFRDAWAVGSGPAYTAVVWTGNPDQEADPADLVGSEAAGPLLFDVLEGVADRAHRRGDDRAPDDLVEGRSLRVLRPPPDRGVRAPHQGARTGPRGADGALSVSSGVRGRARDGTRGGAGVPDAGDRISSQDLRRAAERGDRMARIARTRAARSAGVRRRLRGRLWRCATRDQRRRARARSSR